MNLFPKTLAVVMLGAVLQAAPVQAQTRDEGLLAAANAARPAVLKTLEKLVNIETGTGDVQGIPAMGLVLEAELRELGAELSRVPAQAGVVGDIIVGRFKGAGSKKILMMAHMDTVYPRGMLARSPFRVEGDRAYGPGIADDKGGIAVILHSLRLLKERGFNRYGQITVMFDTDEERGSRGSRALIQSLAGDSDYVLSFEPTPAQKESFVLGLSGGDRVMVKVKGRSAHAGVNPEAGVNALVEASDLITRTLDIDDKARGLRFNWTVSKAGTVPNVIPDEALIEANMRYLRDEDRTFALDRLRERAQQKRFPDSIIEIQADTVYPAFVAGVGGRQLIDRAIAIYQTLGFPIAIVSHSGGASDAAWTGKSGKPVIESLGLPGFGYHSPQAEYVMIDAIGRRLYLAAQMVMELSAQP